MALLVDWEVQTGADREARAIAVIGAVPTEVAVDPGRYDAAAVWALEADTAADVPGGAEVLVGVRVVGGEPEEPAVRVDVEEARGLERDAELAVAAQVEEALLRLAQREGDTAFEADVPIDLGARGCGEEERGEEENWSKAECAWSSHAGTVSHGLGGIQVKFCGDVRVF